MWFSELSEEPSRRCRRVLCQGKKGDAGESGGTSALNSYLMYYLLAFILLLIIHVS
jgi:hypothetical protein